MPLYQAALNALAYAGVGLAILALGWFALDLATPGHLGKQIFLHNSASAAVIAFSAQLGLAAVVATAMWTNGGGLGRGLAWTAAFGVIGVVLQIVGFFVLDLLTPGKLGAVLTAQGFHPAALLASGIHLAVAIIICAAIA